MRNMQEKYVPLREGDSAQGENVLSLSQGKKSATDT